MTQTDRLTLKVHDTIMVVITTTIMSFLFLYFSFSLFLLIIVKTLLTVGDSFCFKTLVSNVLGISDHLEIKFSIVSYISDLQARVSSLSRRDGKQQKSELSNTRLPDCFSIPCPPKGIGNYSLVSREASRRVARTTENRGPREHRRRCIIDEGAPAGVRKQRRNAAREVVQTASNQTWQKDDQKKKEGGGKKEKKSLCISLTRGFSRRGVAGTLETLASSKLDKLPARG